MLKRLLDCVSSFLGLIAFFPLFLLVGILIKVDSPGPVFYLGERVGMNGRLFRMCKFRTMVENAEAIGGFSTPADDPRLTRFGRILRRHKLDELPQLINVLRGEMSMVGPRPDVVKYVNHLEGENRRILSVRPGMTDYSSLRFFNEGEILSKSDDPERTYLEEILPIKIKLQLDYVKRRSLLIDLEIILATLKRLVG